jgi:hypothetical protein
MSRKDVNPCATTRKPCVLPGHSTRVFQQDCPLLAQTARQRQGKARQGWAGLPRRTVTQRLRNVLDLCCAAATLPLPAWINGRRRGRGEGKKEREREREICLRPYRTTRVSSNTSPRKALLEEATFLRIALPLLQQPPHPQMVPDLPNCPPHAGPNDQAGAATDGRIERKKKNNDVYI